MINCARMAMSWAIILSFPENPGDNDACEKQAVAGKDIQGVESEITNEESGWPGSLPPQKIGSRWQKAANLLFPGRRYAWTAEGQLRNCRGRQEKRKTGCRLPFVALQKPRW